MSLWLLLLLMLSVLPITFKRANSVVWGHLAVDTSALHPSLFTLPNAPSRITDEPVIAKNLDTKRHFGESDSTLVIEMCY
jgi:hypothetical protein